MDTSFDPTPAGSAPAAPRQTAPLRTNVVQSDVLAEIFPSLIRRNPKTLLEANSAEEIAAVVASQELERPQPTRPRRAKALAPFKTSLELRLAPATVAAGYSPHILDRVEVSTAPQRAALQLLTASLIANQAELTDGTRVTRPQQALVWLLDQLAIATPSKVLDQLMEAAA